MFNRKRKLKLKFRSRAGRRSPISNKSVLSRKRKLPLFEKKAKKIFNLALFSAFIITVIYTIWLSGYFEIREIIFSKQDLENNTLKDNIHENLKENIGKNILFTDAKELEKRILRTFPELEKIELKKNYPHAIKIDFQEYPMAANVINESTNLKKSYIINTIGFAIKEDYENPGLPYIRVETDAPLNPKNALVEPEKLKYILETVSYFEEKFGMPVKEVTYKPIPREIHLLTERGFYIWLDIQKSSETQLLKLKKSLVKLDIYNEALEYIDLRISGSNGDKIIYKRN